MAHHLAEDPAELNDTEPELSVIMPVLNGVSVVERQLEALSTQRTERSFFHRWFLAR